MFYKTLVLRPSVLNTVVLTVPALNASFLLLLWLEAFVRGFWGTCFGFSFVALPLLLLALSVVLHSSGGHLTLDIMSCASCPETSCPASSFPENLSCEQLS